MSDQPSGAEVMLCLVADLIPDSGVAVLWGQTQIALFYLPDSEPAIYGIGNRDPIGGANVIARGILGDKHGQPVVASPLYKHHFGLQDGRCLEDPNVSLPVYDIAIVGEQVVLQS